MSDIFAYGALEKLLKLLVHILVIVVDIKTDNLFAADDIGIFFP